MVLGTVSLKQVVTLPQSSCAHRKTKVGAGNGEQVHGVLHVFRTTGMRAQSLANRMEVTELVKVDLGLGLKAWQVEQFAVCSVSDVDAWV